MGLRGPGAAQRKPDPPFVAPAKRGPGSARLNNARSKVSASSALMPWRKKGLTRAERVIAFLEFLPITKGILAGQRMQLLPKQREFCEEVYGRTKEDGRRQISTAIDSAPKGNGKTGFTAGLMLCHLLGPEAEVRGECYSAAIDRQQAGIMFNEMEATIFAVPQFAARVNIQRFHKRIEVLNGDGDGSIYEALSADARRAHGLAPSFWAYDELAQAKDRTLLDNLMEGMGKRREALGVILSTQARDDVHALSELIDYGLQDLDPSFFVQLICAPLEADPFDEETWKACNPAWGKYLDEDDLRKSANLARNLPSKEPSFRNLRLNQRVDAGEEHRAVTAAVWKQGAVPVNRAKLAKRRCVGALDLSGKIDLTSLTLAFADDEAEPVFDLLPIFWTPEGAMAERRPAEQDRFREWSAAGLLNIVPGRTIRTGWVAAEVARLRVEFDLVALAYDRWRIDDFMQDLEEVDVDAVIVPLDREPTKHESAKLASGALRLVPWGQGFKDMGPAVENLIELALTQRIRHGGHAVLNAAFANAIVTKDPADNQKFDKDRSNRRGPVRIDGAVTTAMALALAKRLAGDAGGETKASVHFL
jgi:phage terminase large subunit-like protein